MEKRKFGRTDMMVTPLAFGAMELRRLEQKEADALLNRVLDEGVNYIDTSRDYPTSEEKLGKAISHRRDEFFIATKCGCNMHLETTWGHHVHIWDTPTLERNLENSLRELKTDHLDIWQMHMALPEDLDGDKAHEAIQTMQKFKTQGKVRAIGVSLRHGFDHEPGYPSAYGYRCIKEFMTWGVFDMFQIVYGGMVRTSENAITRAAEAGHAIKVRGVVKDYYDDFDQRFRNAGMEELLGEGEDRRSFLIRFALSHPGVTNALVGTASQDHLMSNIRAAEKGALPADVYAEAKKRLLKVGYAPEP